MRRKFEPDVDRRDGIFAFRVEVTPEALQIARQLHAVLGPPPSSLPHSIIEPSETPANQEEAQEKWSQVLGSLVKSGRSSSKVRRVLSPLRAVEWDGNTLTLEGPLSMDVFELLESQTLCEFRFVLGQ